MFIFHLDWVVLLFINNVIIVPFRRTIYKSICIKTQRIKWWGQLDGMEAKLVKQITDWNPKGVRTKGRQNDK